MDCFYKFVLGYGKLWAFLSTFVVIFCVAAAAFLVLFSPLSAFGVVQFDLILSGAIGCGIGSATVSATIVAMYA